MNKLRSHHPFLLLGIVTILIGGWWHTSGIDPNASATGAAVYRVVYVLGFFFIAATRVLRSLTDNVAVSGIGSLVLGIIPYLVADWALRRRRRGRIGKAAVQHG